MCEGERGECEGRGVREREWRVGRGEEGEQYKLFLTIQSGNILLRTESLQSEHLILVENLEGQC